MPQCATCSQSRWILYHVTVSCKGPIEFRNLNFQFLADYEWSVILSRLFRESDLQARSRFAPALPTLGERDQMFNIHSILDIIGLRIVVGVRVEGGHQDLLCLLRETLTVTAY